MDASLDSFLDGKLKIYQPIKGYRAGIDSVILAASVKDYKGCNILDAGCGVGVISYCIAFRCKNVNIIGIEKNKEYYSLAKKSLKLNKLESNINFINKNFLSVTKSQTDIIVSNPPWFRKNSTYVSKNILLNEAKIESLDLTTWIKKVWENLSDKGEYYTIFPFNRIKELTGILKKYFKVIKIYPLCSFKELPPNRAIIYAKKTAIKYQYLEFDKIIIHKADKTFMDNINDLLHKGISFPLT